jgi:putative hydrolase of the HAD superfamily
MSRVDPTHIGPQSIVKPSIQAITFDFWRTLYFAKPGTGQRFEARVRSISLATGVPAETVAPVFERISEDFLRTHIVEQRTPHPREAIPMLREHLRCPIEPAVAAKIIDQIDAAFAMHPPEMIPGALEAVRAAAELVPVGIVSDTGMTTGAAIRAMLEREGFGEYIRVYSFSDEVGVAKPQSGIFHHAASSLGVATGAILHIGDLEPTDVVGALNVGARAALFAGDNRRYVDGTRASHVFEAWSGFRERLPDLVGIKHN